jgi:hypothetical protein
MHCNAKNAEMVIAKEFAISETVIFSLNSYIHFLITTAMNKIGGNSNKELAEGEYERYLVVAERLVGNKVTLSSDLERVCHKLFGGAFKGVFPSDRVPRLRECECAIVNVDKSNQRGSHWMAVTSGLLYDSFGRRNIDLISHAKLKQEDTELDAEQTKTETNCGARCIAFLIVWALHGAAVAKYI